MAIGGGAAPSGGNFSSFGTPIINSAGQVSFTSALTGGSSTNGAFAGSPGSLQTVALLGTAAPSGGNYSQNISLPTINSAGVLSFYAMLSGGSSSTSIVAGTPGSLQTVVRDNTATPAGGTFGGISKFTPVDTSGKLAFYSTISGGSSSAGVFYGNGASLQSVAVAGNAAPAGGDYSTFNTLALNESGQVGFYASLTGGSSSEGIYAGVPGSLKTIARQGNLSPAGGTFSSFAGTQFAPINSAGQVLFSGTFSGAASGSGLFVGSPTSTQTVILNGRPAPAGGNLSSIDLTPAFNDAGQVALHARLTGGSASRGIFAGSPGALQTVALQGDTAPDSGGASFDLPYNVVMNNMGQVAFVANLTGTGVTSSNNVALYAGTPGNLVQVIRRGDTIDIDPTAGVDLRTVFAITLIPGSQLPSPTPNAPLFNDAGQIVYSLTFTNGSGIFISSIPEPSTLALIGTGCVMLLRRRRR